MSQMWTRTHQFFPLQGRGGSATKFSGMFPYVDVRLTDDVLDLVDPGRSFPSLNTEPDSLVEVKVVVGVKKPGGMSDNRYIFLPTGTE